MNFTQLLGRHLKDASVIEVLEKYDMTVTYDFDRGLRYRTDRYWAGSQPVGFLLRFNANQVLDTAFLYMQPAHGYRRIDEALLDVPVFQSFAEAQRACIEQSFAHKTSKDAIESQMKWWVKQAHGPYTCHYEYADEHGPLTLITLALKDLI